MKLLWLVCLFSVVLGVAANWSPEDYEIFSLNDKVRSDLGPDTTFYSWLQLTKGPKSTVDEINKAYRKLSRKIHPDKFSRKSKSVRRKADERFQRLSSVGNILKSRHLKSRYDYFLSNGFPKWKGTGYYYSRFRPGMLLTVLVIYLLVSTLQYVSLKISRKQDFKRVVDLKEQIKLQAWNGSFIPPSDGSARKVTAANGTEFHVSPLGEVSMIEQSKNGMILHPTDEYDINTNPGFKESFFYRIPCGLWNFTFGRIPGLKLPGAVEYTNPNRPKTSDPEEPAAKAKAKARKGKKVELPNGKVMYSRKGK